MPRSKRLATQSLYAFCRLADDLVDQRDSVDSASQAIDSLEQSLHAALAGKSVADPRVRALAAASHQYGIPREHLVAILDGVRMDLDAQLYKTSEQLEHYCEHVASAVGLAAIHIWGFRTWEAIEPARQCGLAFQMTNILRDIQEDLQRGKIYLPTDDFARCGCDPADLRAGRIGPSSTALQISNLIALAIISIDADLSMACLPPMVGLSFEQCLASTVRCLRFLNVIAMSYLAIALRSGNGEYSLGL